MEQTSSEFIHDLNFKEAVAAYVKPLGQQATSVTCSFSFTPTQAHKTCTTIFSYSGNVDSENLDYILLRWSLLLWE